MTLSKALIWRGVLVILTLVSLALCVTTWWSGERETREAYASSRRLVIDRDTGIVHGRVITTPPPEAEKKPPEEKPAEETPAPAPEEVPAEPVTIEEKPAGENNPDAAPVVPVEQTPAPEAPAPASEKPAEETPSPAAEEKPTEAPAPVAAPEPKPPAVDAAVIAADNAKVAQAIVAMPILSSAPTLTPSDKALPEVKKELTEESDNGLLPVIGADGTKAWKYYARPSNVKGAPVIAIVITGLGQNKIVAENALKLPEEISLSFSGYARDAKGWANASRITAHETLVDLPLEPSNYPVADPGPHGLLLEKGPKENEMRLQWFLSRFGSYVGLTTPANERFSSDAESFKILLQSIANRGLMVVMSREPPRSDTKALIEASVTPLVVGDMLIDEELSASAIQTRLTALEQLAKKRGYALGIAQPYPITVEQLKIWSQTLAEKGIRLVPVSAIARQRFS